MTLLSKEGSSGRFSAMLTRELCFALQTEKSYQRQLGVQIGYKVNKKTKKIPGKAGLRFYKNVGLGFKTPKEAIEGGYFPIGLRSE